MRQDSSSFAALDAYIEGQMRRLRIPGAALAVVDGARVVYRRGYGRSRPGGPAPTAQTPFALGSTTKSFTALAVMQLVEAGQVELDAPVQRYLPWFRVADAEASGRITVRHLLNQTSGLSMFAGTVCLADDDERPDAAERQARGLATLALSHPVGSAFAYCNLNYSLLGLIIEAVSGEPYASYVQQHILAALDMPHTGTMQTVPRRDLATGHRYWFGQPVATANLPFPRSQQAAGGLVSTTEDLAHYLMAYLNGGCYGQSQVLSAAGMAEMHRGAAAQEVLGEVVARYGMGWFVSEAGGTPFVSHGGNVPDFSSFLGLLPRQQLGFVLLTNADHGLPFILMEVGDGIAALLAGEQPRPSRFHLLPWIMRALPLIPLLQVAAAAGALRRVQRWRREPMLRPAGARLWGQHLLLPLAPHLAPAALLLWMRSNGLLRYLRLYMPDLAAIAQIAGVFGGLWAVVRTGLLWRGARARGSGGQP